ncbi:TrbI/VirB10 family protein, partial [Mesorhizobium sp. USDA-HM6]
MNENDIPVEPMRLRADPPRVTRLSRKVLAGIGFVASLGVGGALIYALQDSDKTKQGEELYSTSNRQPADGLAGLPRDYTGPILGPPLPGDLGRPILDAQNKGQPVVPPTIASPAVDEAEQRRRAEEEAARTSRVFFQIEQEGATRPEASGSLAMPSLGDLAGQSGQPNAQARQLAFLTAAADRRTMAPDRVMSPASPYVLQAGAVIPAALITGIRSDLPG